MSNSWPKVANWSLLLHFKTQCLTGLLKYRLTSDKSEHALPMIHSNTVTRDEFPSWNTMCKSLRFPGLMTKGWTCFRKKMTPRLKSCTTTKHRPHNLWRNINRLYDEKISSIVLKMKGLLLTEAMLTSEQGTLMRLELTLREVIWVRMRPSFPGIISSKKRDPMTCDQTLQCFPTIPSFTTQWLEPRASEKPRKNRCSKSALSPIFRSMKN